MIEKKDEEKKRKRETKEDKEELRDWSRSTWEKGRGKRHWRAH